MANKYLLSSIFNYSNLLFINLLLPNYPLLQIKNNSMAAANRLFLPNYLMVIFCTFLRLFQRFLAHLSLA
ncbi:MAG: hypothetical protein EAZ32_19415 [Cytophagia bacterium]|nr:MAG: hypothetical protein EAZ46_12430 [Runella sp.]TAG24013.1 MAG: hypothetical protein EAZ38_02005 [Cytophagales bacterium]TAG34662.1 MAG: hypothetical protein EAZ32_19415 [Cytophagia bacterium]TAG53323.1 MAG: hypothetical protein EAZ29_05805 [Runella slithyformis]TAG76766.1 MAG: hypothetical protein EAZ22_17180 [Cytophagales bacterium]